jgi:negative regulator of flagellin synthesis FlgM
MIDGLGRGAPLRLPGAGADPAARTGAAAPSAPAGRAAGSGPGQIVRDMAAKPPVDSARVETLRLAIAAGTYKPDPDAIAARMIALEQGSRRA